jgi:hypothetical protein
VSRKIRVLKLQRRSGRPRRLRPLLAAAATLVGLGSSAATARAASLITSFTAGVLVDENTANPQPSDYATQAGSHPDVAFTKFTLDTSQGSAQNVRVDLPAGLSVNPQAVPRCGASGTTLGTCAAASRIGTATVTIANIPIIGKQTVSGAVYNMTPPNGAPSDFAFQVTVAGLFTVRTDLIGGMRWYPSGGLPGDYGEYFTIDEISNLLGTALEKSELVFWGAPAEHNGGGGADNAFLTNPTSCSGVQTTYISASTYSPVVSGTGSYTTPVGASGCASVPFVPTISITPSTTKHDSPDGLTVDLHVPQDQNPTHVATAHVDDASVTPPPGLSLNPSAASGLTACSDAQFAVGSNATVACPPSSAVGTVEVSTPVLGSALTGSVYVGRPLEGEPYRLFVDAENATSGVAVRLVGSVSADPQTGQLTTTFSGSPQLPFTDLKLMFKTGAGALFANPPTCGGALTTTSLAPWSGGAAAAPSSSFTVDANGSGGACPSPLPFAPAMVVTPTSTTAGASTGLNLGLTRVDGDQTLRSVTARLPEGMLANLGAVTLCGEPAATQGTCAASSQIGTVTVGAGAGAAPLSLPGTVYFTGPYGGQPFGLSIVVPAIAGPYDLGTVVVRAAVAVDTQRGQVTIATDSLPTILQGIPLRLRSIALAVSRSGFLVNPTSCAPTAFAGSVSSVGELSVPFESAVTMTGCASLSFSPTLAFTPTSTVHDGPTGLTMDLSLPAGGSDLASAIIELPEGLTLNPAVASGGLTACTDSQLAQGSEAPTACPVSSAIGTVEILTPLLGGPMTGSVYVGQPLSADPQSGQEYRLFLDAESPSYGLSVRLIGEVAADPLSGRLTVRFPSAPPVPFSELKVSLTGGAHAVLANPQDCGTARFDSTLTPVTGAPATPGGEYSVDLDGSGGECPATTPFAPTQAVSDQPALAGASAAFALSLTRPSGQQYLSRLSTALPIGLLGRIAAFGECPDALAATGACPTSSRVGSVSVEAGAGSDPLLLEGSVYLTGPYEGAPFGLAIVLPAQAVGPFDYGTIVVRARVLIDERTLRASVVSDPLPTIVGGVPLRLRSVTVTTDPAFTVNPTSCTAQTGESTLVSLTGTPATLTSPFQVEDCAQLGFQPTVRALTSARASKQDGASLTVALALPSEGEANLASVSATLPPQLAARTSTLQEACPEGVFAGAPQACPAASRVGTATVSTPLLAQPLAGPAYLVSNGGAAFPDLDLVLSGDGLRLLVRGQTDIEGGLTTASFASVPDVPFSLFTLTLPMGTHSALGAAGPLCQGSPAMSVRLIGQNGLVSSRQVAIGVAGCPGAADALSRLKISPSRFRATRRGGSIGAEPSAAGRPRGGRGRHRRRGAGGGARVSYIVTAAGSTTFVVLKPVKGETRKPMRRGAPASQTSPSRSCVHALRAPRLIHPRRHAGYRQLPLHRPPELPAPEARALPAASDQNRPGRRGARICHDRFHHQARLGRSLPKSQSGSAEALTGQNDPSSNRSRRRLILSISVSLRSPLCAVLCPLRSSRALASV